MTCWVGSSHSSYHPPKFGVHRPCESGDNVFYLSSDHVVDVSRDFCAEFSHSKSPPC